MVNFGTTSRLQMVTNTEKNVLMTISCPKDLRKAVLKIGNFVVSIFFIQSELRRNISTDELFDCYRHNLWSLGKVCAKKQSQTMNISRVISQNVSGQSYHTLAKVTGLYYTTWDAQASPEMLKKYSWPPRTGHVRPAPPSPQTSSPEHLKRRKQNNDTLGVWGTSESYSGMQTA